MNILIVDDHEENLYLLESLLKGSRHTVRPAANGAEALEVLAGGGIDLIISDILMPVMDGFQLCRNVRTSETLCAIPFIFYTATYTGPQDMDFALKIGADRFLVKPCEPETFMNAVNEVMTTAGKRDGFPLKPPAGEEEILRLYSEGLVRKLEQKIEQADREIKARQEAETSLRESESRFRLFADTAPVGVVIADRNQNAIYVSPKFVSLFGYTLEDIPTVENWFALAYPDDALKKCVREEWTAALIKARETCSETTPMEFPVSCKDGTIREIEFRLSTTRDFDFVVFTDITERKRAEEEREKLREQLTQAQKMESVGRLAGGVAHDFNNMLNVIIGYTDLALNKTRPEDPLHDDLKEISQAAIRASEITHQLLAFARRQTIMPTVLDLNEAVDGILKMLRRLIGEDIDLVWQPKAGLWPVKMDSTQVDQILANLCVNARDAIMEVGKIIIGTDNLRLDEINRHDDVDFVPGDYVLLTVSDDGAGMDKETLNRLFEPFFTTKGIGKGTGLGLATVYGIVRQNNGFINVSSQPDRGSTFRIYLPRYEGEAGDIRTSEIAEIPGGNGETVLLVEDEMALLKLVRRMLSILGYKVLTAPKPTLALNLAGEHRDVIDLLITDVVMPEMNGRDLAEKLRAINPNIKVLFMSGYTEDAIGHQGVLDKGVHFMQKPFNKRALARKVRESLENNE